MLLSSQTIASAPFVGTTFTDVATPVAIPADSLEEGDILRIKGAWYKENASGAPLETSLRVLFADDIHLSIVSSYNDGITGKIVFELQIRIGSIATPAATPALSGNTWVDANDDASYFGGGGETQSFNKATTQYVRVGFLNDLPVVAIQLGILELTVEKLRAS